MIKTVNGAFSYFMENYVNLDSQIYKNARSSRDNLLENIKDFNSDSDFFKLVENFNIHFGSFARKTKCRKLDDIDLMIGISADGAKCNFQDRWDDMKIITISSTNLAQKECTNSEGYLNSTMVLNRFKKKLECIAEYSKSEINKHGEAVVLNLKSRDWSFDIVPCFHTVKDDNGKDYYLIPNGKGNWKKTDPRIDRDHVINTNRSKDGKVLELIRLVKKWNKVKKVKNMPSYLLETLLINYCDSRNGLEDLISHRFLSALGYLENNIYNVVNDMKGIQGNINNLTYTEKLSLHNAIYNDYMKAKRAIVYEDYYGNQKEAINIWREIFGGEFPNYED